MAAQFADEKLPSKHQEDKYVELLNGRYSLTIRQLYDPADFDQDAENATHFEIIAAPASNSVSAQIKEIFWWEG